MNEAAQLFAERKARKLYGRNAEVGALRQDGYCPDGSYANYQAFVGRPNKKERNISGGNVHFSVSTPS